MSARRVLVILIAVLMMAAPPARAAEADGGTGAPTTAQSPAPVPSTAPTPMPEVTPPVSTKPVDDPHPAVSVFRVTYDAPYGRGPFIGIGGGGLVVGYNTVQTQGSVWWANDTNETLRDVKVVVHFWSRRFYRRSGSETYPIGTMDPKQRLSLNYRSWVIPAERDVPYIEVIYRREGQDQLYRIYNWPYGR